MSKTLDKIPYYIERYGKLKPYWDGLNEGILKTTKCNQCNEVHFPPRILCSNCFSTDLSWTQLPLEGKIKSFTYVEIPPHGFKEPYYLAIVEIEKLKKPIMGRLYSSSPPKIGQTVSITFEDIDTDQAVIVFKT